MIYFDSADIYIQSKSSLNAKIAAIDLIIDALISTGLKAAATGNIQEYSLNDGQTTIKTMYRNVSEVKSAINAFEAMRQVYVNRRNGRVVRLMDEKNFRYGGY